MTSKGLFFKYMRENTKQRLWSVALTALLCFFLFPVLTALETSIMLRPVSTGCVLIDKNEPRKYDVSGVLLCVFLQ